MDKQELAEKLIGAIARAWCISPNDVKVVDPDLAKQIIKNVEELILENFTPNSEICNMRDSCVYSNKFANRDKSHQPCEHEWVSKPSCTRYLTDEFICAKCGIDKPTQSVDDMQTPAKEIPYSEGSRIVDIKYNCSVKDYNDSPKDKPKQNDQDKFEDIIEKYKPKDKQEGVDSSNSSCKTSTGDNHLSSPYHLPPMPPVPDELRLVFKASLNYNLMCLENQLNALRDCVKDLQGRVKKEDTNGQI